VSEFNDNTNLKKKLQPTFHTIHTYEKVTTKVSYDSYLRKSYNQGFIQFILTKRQILFLLQVLQFLPRLLGPKNNPSDVHLHGQSNSLSDSTSEEKSHIVFI